MTPKKASIKNVFVLEKRRVGTESDLGDRVSVARCLRLLVEWVFMPCRWLVAVVRGDGASA